MTPRLVSFILMNISWVFFCVGNHYALDGQCDRCIDFRHYLATSVIRLRYLSMLKLPKIEEYGGW